MRNYLLVKQISQFKQISSFKNIKTIIFCQFIRINYLIILSPKYMNKKTKSPQWSKPISFNQAKQIIRKLNHEAPIMDALLASGSKEVLMQLVKYSNRNDESQQQAVSNNFDKIIDNHHYQSYQTANRQSCSFINYKKSPQKNNSALIASHKVSYSEIKKHNQKSYAQKSSFKTPEKQKKMLKSRIVTMPSELQNLKEQLLSLPIISANKKSSLYSKNRLRKKSRFTTEDSLLYSGAEKEDQRKQYRYLNYQNEEEIIERFSPSKSMIYSLNKEKSVFSQGNSIVPIVVKERQKTELSYSAQKIMDIMEKGKRAANIKAARMTLRNQLTKLKNAGNRLSNFMNFQNYPSQRAMKLLDSATKIQKIQEKAMQRQTFQVKNNETLGEKYKMMVKQERNRYKNNVRQFTQMKKKHKISLIRIEAIAQLGNKKPDLRKEKIENVIFTTNQNTSEIKNQLQEQGKKLKCSLCTLKSS